MEHRERREDLGAYVLGALDSLQRREMERHLEGCAACRDELATLSGLRQLLDRLDEADLVSAADGALDSASLTTALSAARRRERWRLRAWQGLAAAGIAIAVVLGSGVLDRAPQRDILTLQVVSVSDEAATASGEVAATAWEWGSTVSLEMTSLPRRDGYVVWVIAADGRREQAGSWGPTSRGDARVRGASRIQADEIVRVEITDLADGLLLAYTPPG